MSDAEALLHKSLLRPDEAARVLGVSTRTISRYLDAGKLTLVMSPSGRRRVRMEDIKRFL